MDSAGSERDGASGLTHVRSYWLQKRFHAQSGNGNWKWKSAWKCKQKPVHFISVVQRRSWLLSSVHSYIPLLCFCSWLWICIRVWHFHIQLQMFRNRKLLWALLLDVVPLNKVDGMMESHEATIIISDLACDLHHTGNQLGGQTDCRWMGTVHPKWGFNFHQSSLMAMPLFRETTHNYQQCHQREKVPGKNSRIESSIYLPNYGNCLWHFDFFVFPHNLC